MGKGPVLPNPQQAAQHAASKTRSNQLLALVEHCTAAQTVADRLGEKFLAYMLAMTIQEAKATLGREPGAHAGFVAGERARRSSDTKTR